MTQLNLMQTIYSLLSDGPIVGLAIRYLTSVLSKSTFVNSCLIDIVTCSFIQLCCL